MPLPLLGVAARFVLAKGVREATKKYGKIVVKKAQGQIKKRKAARMDASIARSVARSKKARKKRAPNTATSAEVQRELFRASRELRETGTLSPSRIAARSKATKPPSKKSRRLKKLAKGAAAVGSTYAVSEVAKKRASKKRTSKRKSR